MNIQNDGVVFDKFAFHYRKLNYTMETFGVHKNDSLQNLL